MTDYTALEWSTYMNAECWPYNLANNLAIGCGLTESHALGMRACTCDVGPCGLEWHPGMGVSPDQCTRLPNDAYDDHVFDIATEPPFVGACKRCRERLEHYAHMTPNHPSMFMTDEPVKDESTWYWTAESLAKRDADAAEQECLRLAIETISISRAPTRRGGPLGQDPEDFELDQLYSGPY